MEQEFEFGIRIEIEIGIREVVTINQATIIFFVGGCSATKVEYFDLSDFWIDAFENTICLFVG